MSGELALAGVPFSERIFVGSPLMAKEALEVEVPSEARLGQRRLLRGSCKAQPANIPRRKEFQAQRALRLSLPPSCLSMREPP